MSTSRARLILIAGAISLGRVAHARTYDLYRADYVKGAYCAAIGGACASDDDIDSAMYQNPASLTARGADWDYDYDFSDKNVLEPQMEAHDSVVENIYSGSYGWSGERWGLGVSLSYDATNVLTNAAVDDPGESPREVDVATKARTGIFNVLGAYRVSPRIVIGAGVTLVTHGETISSDQFRGEARVTGAALSPGVFAGALYLPGGRFRFGSWLKSPITVREHVAVHVTSFGRAYDYDEDALLHAPVIWALGVSYLPWRDERSFFFDLDVVGRTPDGYLRRYDNALSALGRPPEIAKGRRIVIEPRLGFRAPWAPKSRGTLLSGLYLEPSRTQGYSPRLHVTGGLAYKIFESFELMAGVDLSREYTQVFITYR